MNEIQESLEETRTVLLAFSSSSQSADAVIKSVRASFEKAIQNARVVERALADVTQKTSSLSAKQSDDKPLKEIADGEACREYRGYSAATIELICYQDKNYKLWSYVKTGRKVIFYNNSSESMWIASNPHPAHSDLAGFDQGKAVPKGGTYEYTFTKPGKYYFHNHMNPERTGKVKVSSNGTIEIETEDIQMNQPLGGWPPITNEVE